MMLFAVWLSCECSPPEPTPPRQLGHMDGWQPWVRSIARGDAATSQVHSRDLSVGTITGDHGSVADLGAALGFLQIAEDPEELALGLGRAVAACGACHRALAVSPPPAPTWRGQHATAAEMAAWGAMWHLDVDLTLEQIPEELRRAWTRDDRLASVVEACHTCHATTDHPPAR